MSLVPLPPEERRRLRTARRPGHPAPGADEGAILVNTKNNVQMLVEGSITFTLNESCTPYKDKQGVFYPGGILQKFHDTIGKSHQMYASDGGDEPGWWKPLSR